MSTNARNSQERTARLEQSDRGRIRPHYIRLGVDNRGADHVYQTTSETIHIIHEDGSRGRRLVPADKTIDDYMAAVADAHGWAVERYGADLTEMLADTLDE
jgi:hypothetical protein